VHHLNTEEEYLLIWLWQNHYPGMGFCRSNTDGEPFGNGSPVWTADNRVVTIKDRVSDPYNSGETLRVDTYTFPDVKAKHIKSLAYSKGYGGPLVKIYHGWINDPKTGYPVERCKPWRKVTIELTKEGLRWADSPYLRSQHEDHPSRPEVKAAKAKARAEAKQQETIERMAKNIEELTKRLDQYTSNEERGEGFELD